MKSAESKTATAAQPAHAQEHAQQPFFQKDGQGAFFSEETKQKGAFFNPPAVQPKLTIGKPGDKYEQEADAMAEKVVGQISENNSQAGGSAATGTGNAPGHTSPTVQAQPAAPSGQEQLQRQEGEEEIKETAPEVQRKAIFESNEDTPEADVQTKLTGAPLVQAKCDKCEQEEQLQRKEEEEMSGPEQEPLVQRMCAECATEEENAASDGGAKEEPDVQTQADSPAPTASPDLQSRLNNTKGGGQSLPEDTRSSMESGFGADFSGVRVHTDGEAAQMNKVLGAHAFTHGSDIYFNEGKYDTGSMEGKKLLAHELTHTVQQGGSANKIQKNGVQSNLDRLNEMLDSWNVPEEDVIALLRQLTDSEKATVLSNPVYKNKMGSAFNISEMVRAVSILNPSLTIKLEWIQSASIFTSQIDYSDIKTLVISAPQSERNALITDRWRGFFVDVCTNQTMVEALNDLGYNLETKLTWLEAEMTITSWELDYATIKPWIIAAPQTERDLLKNDRWRGFFVDVCTNQTMVEALNDLGYNLETKLTWLEAEMTITSWELDYATIKPWIIAAPQTERDLLKNDRWRGFFVDVCTNQTMIEALNDLGYNLETKLTWLEAEMTITSWELDYATIKPWIIAAPQTERDLLKNDRWKDFFIAVCNNLTIVEAVNDIGCDLVTFTWAIEEYNESFAFANTEEADIACAIMNRDINDGVFNGRDEHRPKAYAERAREQIIVADEMENLVGAGATATWRGSGPGSGTTFEQWASAASEGVAPSIVPSTVINCWEMVLLAAFRCGAIDWNRIHALYDPTPPDWGAFLVDQLSFNSRISYNPASPGTARPIRGDVVFFDGASHVALAAGSVDSLGRTQIYSFWPPPNTPFNTAHPQYATVDQVKLTTIEELNDYWVANGNPAFVLEFATANW